MLDRINKTWLVLGVAVVIGGGAALFANRYFSTQMEEIEARARGETIKLVVAKDNLPKGATLSADNLAVRSVPKEWAHSNAVTPAQFERIDNAVLAFPVQRGEALMWSQLEGEKVPTFSARLNSGQRAVTVPVDEISSISGLVEPGDKIDLLVTVSRDNRKLNFVLLQSVQVMATGSKVEVTNDSKDGPSRRTFTTITIDVNPEQARQVFAAREIGKITAMLRAPGDASNVSASRDDAAALLGLIPPPGKARRSVPVIYGGGPVAAVGPRMGGSAAEPAPAVTPNTAPNAAPAATPPARAAAADITVANAGGNTTQR